MNTKSAKAKARRLQNKITEDLLAALENVEADDIRPALMGESGEDIRLSPSLRSRFPYSFECKNQESLSIWKALEQAARNAPLGTTPILVFKRNRSKTYAVLEWEELLKVIAK